MIQRSTLTAVTIRLIAFVVISVVLFGTTVTSSNNTMTTCAATTTTTTTTTTGTTITAVTYPIDGIDNTYQQDGDDAKEIAQYIPYYPFKGIERFYDIGGFLYHPNIFQKIINIFVQRYRNTKIDVIAGLDARGFVLGPPIALALEKPFIMIRKQGKMPNTISTNTAYDTEYGSRSGLTIQRNTVLPGQHVLIIDDLVATGGTLSSAISLIKLCQGIVIECACIVELKLFVNPTEESGLPSRTKLMQSLGHEDIPIWGLISEDVLTVQGTLPSDYVDDGEEH